MGRLIGARLVNGPPNGFLEPRSCPHTAIFTIISIISKKHLVGHEAVCKTNIPRVVTSDQILLNESHHSWAGESPPLRPPSSSWPWCSTSGTCNRCGLRNNKTEKNNCFWNWCAGRNLLTEECFLAPPSGAVLNLEKNILFIQFLENRCLFKLNALTPVGNLCSWNIPL